MIEGRTLTGKTQKVGNKWIGTIEGHSSIQVSARTKKECMALLSVEIEKVGREWATKQAEAHIKNAFKKFR